jgi:hypothetical protein
MATLPKMFIFQYGHHIKMFYFSVLPPYQNVYFPVWPPYQNVLFFSIATIPKCVQNLMKNTDCTKAQALESATLHPAELLKITDRKGTLEYNTDADFIMLDDELNVLSTYIAGELVWSSSDWDSDENENCMNSD